MEIISVVAVSENGIIDKNGQLPWAPIPEDLRLFKAETKGHAVIMGRGTWFSLPDKFRPLPGRGNAIITSRIIRSMDTFPGMGVVQFDNLKESLSFFEDHGHEKAFLIGGENIYREGLQYCDEVLLTRVHETVKFELSDKVAFFDLGWFVNQWEGFTEEILGQTQDGRASFYKYVRVR